MLCPITQDDFKSLVSGDHGEPTMSSREIAELTGKNHADVMRDIRSMLDSLKKDASSFADIYFDAYNREQPCYSLPKRETLILVSGYDVTMRAAIIDRWQEFEAGVLVPKTLSSALRLAADQAEVIERQSIALALAAPKVEFVDHYVDATGLKGFREVAKLLKIKEPEFRCFLSDNNIMYRLGGDWVAYQKHIDAGRFAVKAGVSNHSDHAFNSCKFTPKGVEWIAGIIAAQGVRRELDAA